MSVAATEPAAVGAASGADPTEWRSYMALGTLQRILRARPATRAVLWAPIVGLWLLAAPATARPAAFGSPQEAVDALVAAARSGKLPELVRVLGPEGRGIVSSGDAVSDAAARERFLEAFDQSHQIRKAGDGPYILYLGPDDYPFPLPLVEVAGKWSFDTAEGIEEILDRRIGENELTAIGVLKAYVDAQREYAEADRDGKGPQYARRLLSQNGKTDGLYWPTSADEPESPLGPLVANAHAEGYRRNKAAPTPYHGYVFRVLTAQGSAAAGGARDYIVGGRMIGGFGLLATPVVYGNSGVKTFQVNQDGQVFEKDLGEATAAHADRIKAFDPGEGWMPVSAP